MTIEVVGFFDSTIRGPVYDLTEGQVEKLKAGLHGKRGRPPRREAL